MIKPFVMTKSDAPTAVTTLCVTSEAPADKDDPDVHRHGRCYSQILVLFPEHVRHVKYDIAYSG